MPEKESFIVEIDLDTLKKEHDSFKKTGKKSKFLEKNLDSMICQFVKGALCIELVYYGNSELENIYANILVECEEKGAWELTNHSPVIEFTTDKSKLKSRLKTALLEVAKKYNYSVNRAENLTV